MSMGRLLLVALAAALIAGSIAMILIIRNQAPARRTLLAAAAVPAVIILYSAVAVILQLADPHAGPMHGDAVIKTISLGAINSIVALAAGFAGAWLIERWRGR